MLLLGIDLGTSSVKASVIDALSGKCIASVQYPEQEMPVHAPQPGWAEQHPEEWRDNVLQAISKLCAGKNFNPQDIAAIGIAYQMHGLVMIDKSKNVLRPSIIWCDSRAVAYGEKAFHEIGKEKCLSHLLNSPGNFTASKLAWVKNNEPHIYEKLYKILLPGDYISMQLTGEITTTPAALSEGMLWDFVSQSVSEDVLTCFGFDKNIIPAVKPVFAEHGFLKNDVAEKTGLKAGIPVCYKAGDQPNNALSLNVMNPGEVAATAGTSGVIYGVNDKLVYDDLLRVNSFAHVNHTAGSNSIGVLLCINGCGIMNRYVKDHFSKGLSYAQMNEQAAAIKPGSEGMQVFPFGNGAERMLNNKMPGAAIAGMDMNKHTNAHIYRAVQEGIAYAFRFGLDGMRGKNIHPSVIRAGKANMFLSEVFLECFVNITGVPVELYETDGSAGAAAGAGIGAKIYTTAPEAFAGHKPLRYAEPVNGLMEEYYLQWKENLLNNFLK